MIRKFKMTDLDDVMRIWLDTNLKSHCFVPESYWKDNFDAVKEMMPKAEIYVYLTENEIDGFIGLSGNYIEGLFVKDGMQSQGIGKELLDYVKEIKSELSLNVYKKNKRAVSFYKRENFKIISEDNDEYLMKTLAFLNEFM